VPPEDVARMIAMGKIANMSPRTKEMAMISRAVRDCFY
jgi:hypothetical protein